jgi:hypothetical protein
MSSKKMVESYKNYSESEILGALISIKGLGLIMIIVGLMILKAKFLTEIAKMMDNFFYPLINLDKYFQCFV